MKRALAAIALSWIAIITLAACNKGSTPDAGVRLQSEPTQVSTGLGKELETPETVANDSEPDLNHMPVYPGARNVQVEWKNVPGPMTITTFDTKDSDREILAYYSGTLLKEGWICEHEGSCYWPSNQGLATHIFDLWIKPEELTSGDTLVNLYAFRSPDPMSVPTYPG